MRFIKGNRVKISKSSQFYNYKGTDLSNPNCNGTIISTDDSTYREESPLTILVHWDNGESNLYAEEDLLFYDEPDMEEASWSTLFTSLGNKTVEVKNGSKYEREFRIFATPTGSEPVDILYLDDEAWVCDSNGDFLCSIQDADTYASALMAMKEYWETKNDNSTD